MTPNLNEEDRKIVLHALDALAFDKRQRNQDRRAERVDEVIEKVEDD